MENKFERRNAYGTEIPDIMTNRAQIKGRLLTEPKFSHEVIKNGCHDKFYEFMVGVPRLSDNIDEIPVIVREDLLGFIPEIGEEVALHGQIRTYNRLVDDEHKPDKKRNMLIINIFARGFLDPNQTEETNYIEISGYLCKKPVLRVTPLSGHYITDALIAVNATYKKSFYIPCIAWMDNALDLSELPIGEKLRLIGRLQSRKYTKNYSDGTSEERTALELSVSTMDILNKNNLSDKNSSELDLGYRQVYVYQPPKTSKTNSNNNNDGDDDDDDVPGAK